MHQGNFQVLEGRSTSLVSVLASIEFCQHKPSLASIECGNHIFYIIIYLRTIITAK